MSNPIGKVFLTVTLMAFSTAAMAVDGVIEINHAKTLAGGVNDGDDPGYPVTINTGGSYRLTSDLIIPDENTIGIILGASHISLDLNGFSIVGPNTCTGTGSAISCTFDQGSPGIRLDGANLTIKNGTIRSTAGDGLGQFGNIGPTVLESLTVTGSGAIGGDFQTAENDQIRISNCNFIRNNGQGILLGGDGAQVTHSNISHNKHNGISMGGRGNLVSNSSFAENGSSGIEMVMGSAGNLILTNLFFDNGLYGVHLNGAMAYGGNQYDGNVSGALGGIGPGIGISTNICNGSTT
jgi:hypothetical protein